MIDNLFSAAWIWMYAGAFLMLAELLAPGFVIFFFGLSAASVGLLKFAFGEAFALTGQLAAFSVLSVLYLLVLRRYLKRIFVGDEHASASTAFDEVIARTGRVTEAIVPPKPGRILLGDAEWNAVSESGLEVGQAIKVVARENLTLKVEAI